jgi:hypothetical protein
MSKFGEKILNFLETTNGYIKYCAVLAYIYLS